MGNSQKKETNNKKEADPKTGFELIEDLSDEELEVLRILARERADSLLE